MLYVQFNFKNWYATPTAHKKQESKKVKDKNIFILQISAL